VSASTCLVEHVQSYLAGKVPAANVTCQPDVVPFENAGSSVIGGIPKKRGL
jgi:hypothetical protein